MADRVMGLVRSAVVHGEPYEWEVSNAVIAARFGLHPDAIIRFDLNTSPFPPASWDQAMEAARQERRPHEYVDTSYAELTSLIAAYLGVTPGHVVIGAGADEVLDIVSKTFLDNGDAAVVPVPTYPMYAICTRQLGGVIRPVPRGPGFALDVDALAAAAVGAKLVFVCNPNSPTGNAATAAELRALLERAPCPIVVDEAYAEFSGETVVPLIAEYPHLIVVRTLSKAFGLAGMRLGWAVAQPAVVGLLHRVRPPNSVSVVTARVAAAALRDVPVMRAQVAQVIAGREPLAAALRGLGVHVYPSVTNFLLTRWATPAAAQAVADRLLAQGLVVRSYAQHPLLPGHLRITVRTAEENARLLAALTT